MYGACEGVVALTDTSNGLLEVVCPGGHLQLEDTVEQVQYLSLCEGGGRDSVTQGAHAIPITKHTA